MSQINCVNKACYSQKNINCCSEKCWKKIGVLALIIITIAEIILGIVGITHTIPGIISPLSSAIHIVAGVITLFSMIAIVLYQRQKLHEEKKHIAAMQR